MTLDFSKNGYWVEFGMRMNLADDCWYNTINVSWCLGGEHWECGEDFGVISDISGRPESQIRFKKLPGWKTPRAAVFEGSDPREVAEKLLRRLVMSRPLISQDAMVLMARAYWEGVIKYWNEEKAPMPGEFSDIFTDHSRWYSLEHLEIAANSPPMSGAEKNGISRAGGRAFPMAG